MTLLEILIAVVIAGIFAGFAVPKYVSMLEMSHANSAQKLLLEIYGAQKRFHIQNGSYAGTLGALDIAPRAYDTFHMPVVAGGGSAFTASISRGASGPVYTLRINQDRTLSCEPIGAEICERLGFLS